VVARVVLERDLARRELVESSGRVRTVEDDGGEAAGNKRRRIDSDGGRVDVVPPVEDGDVEDGGGGTDVKSEGSPVVPMEETDGSGSTIPRDDAAQLEATWKELSSQRKKTLKAKKKREKQRQANPDGSSAQDGYTTLESIRSWDCTVNKNLHKSSYKAGLYALGGAPPAVAPPSDSAAGGAADAKSRSSKFVVSSARDKQIIFYDTAGEKIVHKDNVKTYVHSYNLDCFVDSTTGDRLVACVGEDSVLRVYATTGAGEDEGWSTMVSTKTPITVQPSSDNLTVPDTIIGVTVHPTGKHLFVVTSNGKIQFFTITRIKSEDGSVGIDAELSAVFEDSGEDVGKCSAIGLHPDGLILATGRDDGKVALWDLKTQKLASVLEGPTDSGISSISFSENGYHFATSTVSGSVNIWDLRKQNIILSLQSPTPEDSGDDASTNAVQSLAFCPAGTFLAYGTSNGEIVLTPVGKTAQSDDAVVLKSPVDKRKKSAVGTVCGLVWRDDAMGLVSCNNSERGIRFWGMPVKDP